MRCGPACSSATPSSKSRFARSARRSATARTTRASSRPRIGAAIASSRCPRLASAPATATTPKATAPRVQYAHSGSVNIAYQVVGSGAIDLVFVMGWVSHLEYFWNDPSFSRFLDAPRLVRPADPLRQARHRPVGSGAGEPAADARTAARRCAGGDGSRGIDARGAGRRVRGRTALHACSRRPTRKRPRRSSPSAATRGACSDADYPTGDRRPTSAMRSAGAILDQWGGPVGLEERAPSMANDPAFREWWASYLRMGASPGAAVALTRMNAADRRPQRPAVDQGADARRAPQRRSLLEGRGRPLPRVTHSRGALRRAARRRPPAVCRPAGRDPRRDRALPGEPPVTAVGGSRARHGAHGVVGRPRKGSRPSAARVRARSDGLARTDRGARRPPAGRGVRRSRPRGPLRVLGDDRGGSLADSAARRHPYRRMGSGGAGRAAHRDQRPDRPGRVTGRGPGVADGRRSGPGIGPAIRRSRRDAGRGPRARSADSSRSHDSVRRPTPRTPVAPARIAARGQPRADAGRNRDGAVHRESDGAHWCAPAGRQQHVPASAEHDGHPARLQDRRQRAAESGRDPRPVRGRAWVARGHRGRDHADRCGWSGRVCAGDGSHAARHRRTERSRRPTTCCGSWKREAGGRRP